MYWEQSAAQLRHIVLATFLSIRLTNVRRRTCKLYIFHGDHWNYAFHEQHFRFCRHTISERNDWTNFNVSMQIFVSLVVIDICMLVVWFEVHLKLRAYLVWYDDQIRCSQCQISIEIITYFSRALSIFTSNEWIEKWDNRSLECSYIYRNRLISRYIVSCAKIADKFGMQFRWETIQFCS